MSEIVTIAHVGQNGDGIAKLKNGETVYVPYTLDGEKVSIDIGQKKGNGFSASVLQILEPSTERIEAPCPYFSKCGGCAAQHMEDDFYKTWKKDIVKTALKRHNIDDNSLTDPIILPHSTRRRSNLKAQKIKTRLQFGYRQKGSHDIINIDSCLVLRPELVQLFTPLKRLLAEFLANKETAEIWISVTNNQTDLYIEMPQHKALSYEERETLASFAKRHNITKFTLKVDGFEDPVYAEGQPTVSFDGIPVSVGAKNFLQASDSADHRLTETLLSFLKDKNIKKVADLFCGRGTFTFAFPNDITVDGYEADRQALEALNNAAKTTAKNIKGVYKNLFLDPLMTTELNEYDAIVLDPPRDGAKEQIKEISKSAVQHIVYISCSPNTFSRDAQNLLESGYQLKIITPIDQFLWSNHIEVIALFEKNKV
ncbi:MAG: 23S rRNA (uracil1939-C5)-methyltransferase [bacterium]|jgi:23S rRNA (uracil1939-C5)-methyltransferase